MERKDENQLSIITLHDDLQGMAVESLINLLEEIISDGHKQIALDFNNVSYIYSRGIGALLKYQKLLKARDGAIYLFNVGKSTRKILDEINLLEYMNAYSTREEMDINMGSILLGESSDGFSFGLTCELLPKNGDEAVIKLVGTIDSEKDIAALKQICSQTREKEGWNMALEIADLIYMDDTAVNEIKDFHSLLTQAGGGLRLLNPNEIIRDQLEIMGLQQLIRS